MKLHRSVHGPNGATGFASMVECPTLGVTRAVRGGFGSNEAMAFGSLVHHAVAHYFLRLKDGADAWLPPREACEAATEEGDLSIAIGSELWQEFLDLLPYVCPRRAPAWTVVAVEEVVPVRFATEDGEVTPTRITGAEAEALAASSAYTFGVFAPRVDLVYQTRNGIRHYIDWKTTSSKAKNETFAADYETRLQVHGMFALAELTGGGVVEIGRITRGRSEAPTILPMRRFASFQDAFWSRLYVADCFRQAMIEDVQAGRRTLDEIPRNSSPGCFRCFNYSNCYR